MQKPLFLITLVITAACSNGNSSNQEKPPEEITTEGLGSPTPLS